MLREVLKKINNKEMLGSIALELIQKYHTNTVNQGKQKKYQNCFFFVLVSPCILPKKQTPDPHKKVRVLDSPCVDVVLPLACL